MLATVLPEGSVEPLEPRHRPVLFRESLELLHPAPGETFVDLTVGLGGHAEAILGATSPDGRLIGIDRDPQALAAACRRLSRFGPRFVPLHGHHRDAVTLLSKHGVYAVDGILADLGVSSLQLDDPARGFSFGADGPLDMRMDPAAPVSAADLVASLGEDDLRRILRDLGEERLAAPIARAIVVERARRPLERTSQLAALVERVAGPRARKYRIHPATRTFQALRIAVNGEVSYLGSLVTGAVSILRRGGRIVVIAFHSLEDRAVKQALRGLTERCVCPPGLPVCACGRENVIRLLTPRAVAPSDDEIRENPRARSARLRAAERL